MRFTRATSNAIYLLLSPCETGLIIVNCVREIDGRLMGNL